MIELCRKRFAEFGADHLSLIFIGDLNFDSDHSNYALLMADGWCDSHEVALDTVGLEDKALCENVQRGMHQLAFKQGWYITDPNARNISEHAIRYFHKLYLDAMATI